MAEVATGEEAMAVVTVEAMAEATVTTKTMAMVAEWAVS